MKFSKHQNKILYKEIKKIIKKHQFCLDLCERVRKFFSEIIFLHFASSSFILCLSLMDLILVNPFYVSLYSILIKFYFLGSGYQ